MKVDHRDIRLTWLEKGEAALARLLDENAVSVYVLRRALKTMREGPLTESADAFEAFLRRRGVLTAKRGPAKPVVGEQRKYKIQLVDDVKFLRVPVDNAFPDREAGEELLVSFDAGHISIDDASTGEPQ